MSIHALLVSQPTSFPGSLILPRGTRWSVSQTVSESVSESASQPKIESSADNTTYILSDLERPKCALNRHAILNKQLLMSCSNLSFLSS